MKKILLIGASLIVSAFAFAPQSQATQWCFYGNDAIPSNSPATLNCAETGLGNFNTGLIFKNYNDTTGTYTITVNGGSDSNGPSTFDNLSYSKTIVENNRGSGEVGLGLLGGQSAELDHLSGYEFLLLDLGVNYTQFTNWQIRMSSVDTDEGFLVYTSQFNDFHDVNLASGAILALDHSGGETDTTLQQFRNLFGVKQYLLVFENFKSGSSDDDILLASIKADLVPEPALGFLLGGSLMALGLLRRKQK